MTIEQFLKSLQTPVCLSGGALGSDTAWGEAAKTLGHRVLHWSTPQHKSKLSEHELVCLTQSQLLKADPAVHRANQTLQRRFQHHSPIFANVFRRNWYQVAWTNSLYAIVNMDNNQKIDGGTAWAVQMYIDRFLYDKEDIATCQLFCYDQNRNIWLSWRNGWQGLNNLPKSPTGLWTGIGTRKLGKLGLDAIKKITV
jgi:hypothetical protein